MTAKDSAFAIDLMKNLKLSGKQVTSDLHRLAESDKDWHRRKNELTGNRPPFPQQHIGKGRMGLGHGQKAMHSGMFSNNYSDDDSAVSSAIVPPPPPPPPHQPASINIETTITTSSSNNCNSREQLQVNKSTKKRRWDS